MSNDTKLEISDGRTMLNITWSDGHKSRSHVKRLRFHCRCNRCVPSFSGMMPIDKSTFTEDMEITKVEIKDGVLNMDINEEAMGNHVTTIPMTWLRENCHCEECIHLAISKSKFKFPDQKIVPRVSYNSLESKEGKFECAKNIFDVGFCLIENVPTEDSMGEKVGEMFGYIRTTLYEKHYDVVSVPDPCNSAFTSLGLPFHQDLSYYEAMPGVQLLHALAFDKSIQGGQSLLVDMYEAAEILRKESPEDFEVLCRVPGTLETKDLIRRLPAWYQHSRTHIEVDYFGNVVSIYWHPGHDGKLIIRPEDEGPYYKAYANFMNIIKRQELEFSFRLQQGDLIMFNNRRMAHSRKAYKTSEGLRHLQGCYIEIDDLKSTYMVLAHQLGKKVDPPKCGNRCWY